MEQALRFTPKYNLICIDCIEALDHIALDPIRISLIANNYHLISQETSKTSFLVSLNELQITKSEKEIYEFFMDTTRKLFVLGSYPSISNHIRLNGNSLEIKMGSVFQTVPLAIQQKTVQIQQEMPKASFNLVASESEQRQRQATVLPYTVSQVIEYQSDSDPDEDLLF